MKILITGGNGFVGHHVVEHILKNTNWDIVIIDKLSYASAGNDRLRDISVMDNKRVTRYNNDLINQKSTPRRTRSRSRTRRETPEASCVTYENAESARERWRMSCTF